MSAELPQQGLSLKSPGQGEEGNSNSFPAFAMLTGMMGEEVLRAGQGPEARGWELSMGAVSAEEGLAGPSSTTTTTGITTKLATYCCITCTRVQHRASATV